jgi:di/tricarboxylate transporter
MSWEAWVTVGVVGGLLVALARNLAPTDALLLAGFTVLAALRALSDRFPDPRTMAQSFGNEGLITVGALFVVAAGLVNTGAAGALGTRLLGRPRSMLAAQTRMMLPVMGLSAFINNTPVVATFVPVIKEWTRNARLDASKLFIPLSYAAILGGVCTLIGTSTNLVVQGLLIDAKLPAMTMFTLTPVGVPIALVGSLYILLVSRWLLPSRASATERMGDPREYTVVMHVRPGSPVDGKSIEGAGLRNLPGLYLAEVERSGETVAAVAPEFVLKGGDALLFVGLVQSVVDLQKINGLEPATSQVWKLDVPRPMRSIVEAVVSDTSPLVGQSIRESNFRTRYEAVVIAVHRNGDLVRQKIGDVELEPGDTLLLETHEGFLERHRDDRSFLLVSRLDGQVVPRHDRALVAGVIFFGLVFVAAFEPVTDMGILPASLLAALLMVVTGCCSTDQAKNSIEWPVLISIGSALGIARALSTTGAADALAQALITPFMPFGAVGALFGVFLMTVLLTELVSNNAAAALAFPIAISMAASLHAQPMPFAITVAVAASCGFATPIGYQTHMMVYGAGGYRFSDFLRIGIGLDLLCLIVAVLLIPLFFPLFTP